MSNDLATNDGALVAPEKSQEGENQENKQVTTTAEDAENEAKKDTGFQKRINELTKSYRSTEREKQALAAKVAELETQLKAAPKPSDSVAMPKLKDFEYDEDAHAAAVEKFLENKTNSSLESYLAKQEQKKEEKTFQENLERVFQAHEKRAVEFAKTTADFHDAVDSLASVVTFHPAVAQVIGESDSSPQILYYLANNLDEADKLARMPVHLASAQIARIEARLSVPAKRTNSNAPDPVPELHGGGVVNKDPNKMPIGEWMKWRNQKT